MCENARSCRRKSCAFSLPWREREELWIKKLKVMGYMVSLEPRVRVIVKVIFLLGELLIISVYL